MNNGTFLPVSEINSHYRVGPLRASRQLEYIKQCTGNPSISLKSTL